MFVWHLGEEESMTGLGVFTLFGDSQKHGGNWSPTQCGAEIYTFVLGMHKVTLRQSLD
jgi:hypothetical protein